MPRNHQETRATGLLRAVAGLRQPDVYAEADPAIPMLNCAAEFMWKVEVGWGRCLFQLWDPCIQGSLRKDLKTHGWVHDKALTSQAVSLPEGPSTQYPNIPHSWVLWTLRVYVPCHPPTAAYHCGCAALWVRA